jgi:hypothetical protein
MNPFGFLIGDTMPPIGKNILRIPSFLKTEPRKDVKTTEESVD